ncbi:MAG TPA: DUF308 domain-containing protein [Caulobacterales bacterium]|nr:DUF308 domain-containing protein [Caulobacterales bacterium]
MAEPDLTELRVEPRRESAPPRTSFLAPEPPPPRGALPLKFSFTLLGALLVALGALALVFPFVSTLAATLFIGGAFLAAGMLKLASALMTRPRVSGVIKGAWALCYVLGGAIVLYAPLAGAWSLTVVLAGMLIIGGVASAAWALTDPKPSGWSWMAASGALSVVLGGLVAIWLPFAALWFPGVIAGVDLVSTGAAFIAMDRAARNEFKQTRIAS